MASNCTRASISFSQEFDTIRLQELEIVIGQLDNIEEFDGEVTMVAHIEGMCVEVPFDLRSELTDLIGRMIVIGKFDGIYRVAEAHARGKVS